jgi:hypothetical protein
MDARMVLFFMSTLAGFVMIAGGIWLIYKEKIYIDRESNKPVEVKLPGGSASAATILPWLCLLLDSFLWCMPFTNSHF